VLLLPAQAHLLEPLYHGIFCIRDVSNVLEWTVEENSFKGLGKPEKEE